MGAPPQPSPDVRDRVEVTKERNVRRGARITGGPGTKEVESAIRLASRVKAGKASVIQLQTQLRRAGFNISLDGEWGPQTEAAYRTFAQGLAAAEVESSLAEPTISFDASTRDREQRRLSTREEEIHTSMQDFVRSQPKKESWWKRWSAIGMTQRAGDYLAEELAAPALGSTQDFFEALPSIVEARGNLGEAYELSQRQEQRAMMGAPDARLLRGTAALADRFVQDLYQSTVGAPAGLAMAVAHPLDAAKMIWKDYKYRYGPALEGDLDEFARRQAEHPLFAVLDVGALVGGLAKGGQIAGVVQRASYVRKLKVGSGYVQIYQPGSALGQVLSRRLDAFSEKHPDLAFVGANTRGATAIRQQGDRTLDEIRATTVPFQRAAKRLNAEERMAYDVMARYGPDAAAQFIELEINKRWAAANDPDVPRAVRMAQKAQHHALRRAAGQVVDPSDRLMRALTLGRELTEGAGLSTETMKFELRMLDPETAAGRKDLTAQIFGEMPTVGEVKSRTALYQHLREFYPEHAASLFMEMADAGALHWSRKTGGTPEDYYREKVSEARARIDPELPEELPEGIDVLYQEGLFDTAAYEQQRAARAAARQRPPVEASDMPDSIDVRAVASAAAGFKLPDELATPAKLRKGIARVYEYARRGAAHRDWYDRAAEVAKTVAAQYGITPDQSAQLFAIYSQAADVIGNAKFVIDAVRSFQQTGTTAGIGRFPARQHAEADAVLKGQPWRGRKRNSFYANIIESVDPVAWRELNGGKPVTVDRWVVRMFAPASGKIVPGSHYDAMERIVVAMADQLGWEPKEIQAAAWVAIKSDALRERHPAWSEARIMRAAADAYEEGYRRHGAQVGLFDLTPIDEAQNIRGRVVEFAERAINDVRQPDGGFTVFPKTMRPDNEPKGYAVAYGAYERKVPAELITEDDLVAYVRDHQEVLDADPNARIGGWHNPDDGQVYLDITKIVDDAGEAEKFMREQGQLSMLDREAAFGRSDWDNAFIQSGLTPEAADAIKAGHQAVARWHDLVTKAARDQLGTKGKVGTRQFEMAEDIILRWAEDHPESGFSAKVRDLYLSSHKAQQAPDPEQLFQRDMPPLEGLPPRGQPNPEVRDIAAAYMQGRGYDPPTTYATVEPERATRIAEWYDKAEHAPDDPAVRASYAAFARETLEQYEYLQAAGYRFEFYPEADPYPAGPWQAMDDLRENRHLYVFPTDEGFGTQTTTALHPLLEDSGVRWGGRVVTHNDLFRAVHDVMGHHKEGVGFRADGEENAWRQHVAMYSDEAKPSMTAETRGQNSWVNYGPHGERNRTAGQAETVYADQKATLAPEWVIREGADDTPEWVIPEDAQAWVRGGMSDDPNLNMEGLADEPDIPFTPREARPADMSPAPPRMPEMRRLPDESDADFQRRSDAAAADFAMREAAHGAQESIKLPQQALDRLLAQPLDDTQRFIVEETIRYYRAGEHGKVEEILAGIFENEMWPDELKPAIGNALLAIQDYRGTTPGGDIPPNWLAQEKPDAGDYEIVSERPSQVGVRRKGERGVMYFDSRAKADDFIADQVKRREYLLEKHPDAYYQRANKFGVTVKPDAGRVRGMADFGAEPGKVRFGFDPEAANFSTAPHEISHMIRRFMPEATLRQLEDILGVEDGAWKRAHEEKFAKMTEAYFWRGQAPNWQLRAAFAEMRAGMREVYRTTPRPGGISAEEGLRLYGLLDEVFNRTLSLRAGDGAFYMPDVASWRARGATSGRRKSLRQAKVKQMKNRGVLVGQGRIQRGPKVTVLEFNRTARLYENRVSIKYLEEIADDLDLDNHPETGGVPPGYGLFNPRSVDVPRIYRETPTSDDLFGKFPHEMAQEMQHQRDELLAAAFPNDLELIPAEYRRHAKVLPLQVIEAFTGDKVAIRMARSPRVDKLVAALDTTNAVMKAALIYGKLSYIPLNLAGNVVFLTLAAGPFAGPALVRAARGIGGLDPELLAQIDFHVGEGAAAALALEERNAVARTVNKLAYGQSAVADRLPRRAAWIYHAARSGFISEGSIRKLLEGGDEVWRDGVTFKEARYQISEAAERDMVQFRGMSPFQQEVISRAVFIYGWIRGATKYGLHSAVERPIRTDITVQLGQDAWDEMQEKFGKLVSYLDGITPVGKIQEMLGVEVIPVRQTQAINPVSTAGEALAAIYNTAKGDMKEAGPVISDYLSPAIKTPIEFATGYNIFFGEQYDNRWEAVYGQPMRWPAIKIGKQLISPEITDADVADQPVERQPNWIIPSEGAARKEALWELFFGSARERNLNFKAAEARGREQRGEKKGYTDYREELIDQLEEAGMGRPPEVVLEELRTEVALDADPRLERGSSYQDKLAAAAEAAGFEAPTGLTDAAAEKMYLDLRRELFKNLHAWENQADKIIDAQLEGE